MTQPEYEQKKQKCWEEFIDEGKHRLFSRYEIFCAAFNRAYALGKQEKDADTVIQGWVARDSDGDLFIYKTEPKRESGIGGEPDFWVAQSFTEIDSALFPDLTWESDPIEVELIIKRKKNG